MATIATIINELQTIATAFTSVNSFYFEEIAYINDDVSKTYPAILVNSRSVDYTIDSFENNYLPRKKNFTLQIYFLDTYKQAEKDTTDKQTKYGALEVIADQYLAEIKRRTLESYLDFEFNIGASGFQVDDLHNDKLNQIVYNASFTVKNKCTTGTFSY